MTKSNNKIEDVKARLKRYSEKIWAFSLRWLYLVLLLGIALYSFFIWNQTVVGPEWSEEKKQEYVKGQAVFSFGKEDYLKVVDLLETKKNNLENYLGYKGRDIFYTEGF